MNNLSNPAVELQEKIILREIIPPEKFLFSEGVEKFAADSHIHSFTRAFGLPEERLCACCFEKPLRVEFTLPRLLYSGEKQSRIFLKLVGMLKEWRKYSLPLGMKLNGREFFQGFVFFENVCRGWPSNYFYLPPEVLKEGRNILEILNKSKGKGKENILFVNRVEIIEKLPYQDLALIYVPSLVERGEVFRVEVSVLKPYREVRVNSKGWCEWLGVTRRDLHPLSLEEEDLGRIKEIRKEGRYSFLFQAEEEGVEKEICIRFEEKELIARVGLVCRKEDSLPLWVGTDSDDHRHDESGEMEKILERLYSTEMGNFIGFRPGFGRNYVKPAGKERWKRWVTFCEERKVGFRITTWPLPGNPFPVEFLKKRRFFQGIHLHESYLIFQRLLNPGMKMEEDERRYLEEMERGDTIERKEEVYIRYLSRLPEKISSLNFPIFWGEPSLLAGYLPLRKGDILIAEPVSNVSLLFGLIRGVSRVRGNLLWGAHIPIDWYLGFPHDEAASRRFRILLNLVYTHGGNYAYAENALFKTNAYQRFDEEDRFCTRNREIIRNFYRYVRLHPRKGRVKVNLAVLYGRFEHILWLPDDRIPEVKDTNDWDDFFWGRWKNISSRWSWRAIDGWLPPLPLNEYKDNPSILKLFCGTPFGQVDIIPWDTPLEILSSYKCIVLLGWNTMDENLYGKLKRYVEGGGILYIFVSHFDTRLNPEKRMRLWKRGKISDLTGVEVIGPGERIESIKVEKSFMEEWRGGEEYPVKENIRGSILKNISAQVLARTDKGIPLLLRNPLGRGEVYTGNFWEISGANSIVRFNQKMLRFLGSKVSEEFGIEGANCINYTLWEHQEEDTGRMYLVNVNWKKPGNREKFSLSLWGKTYPVDCREGLIREVVWEDSIALSSVEINIWIAFLKKIEEKLYTAELCGTGEGKILGFLKEKERIEIKDGKGEIFRASEGKKDTFSLPVKVEGKLSLQIRLL